MSDIKVSDILKAIFSSWSFWVGIVLLAVLVSGCVWAFSAGNVLLGIFITLFSTAYFLAITYLFYHIFVATMVAGIFFSTVLKALFPSR